MFGFLKDKLKKAVKKFSKDAKEEVKEEKVEDKKQIEAAKKEEAKIVKKPAKKTVKKAPPKKKTEKKPAPAKKAPKKEAKPEPKKEEPKPKKETKAEKPKKDKPKKKGFFAKVFKKDTPEALEEEFEEAEEEGEKELEEVSKIEEQEDLEERKLIQEEALEEELEEEEEELEKVEKELEEQKEETPEEAEELKEEEEDRLEEDIEQLEEIEEELEEEREKDTGFLGKLKDAFTKKTLSEEKFDELFWELEVAMLENNVAVEVIEKIKKDLKDELTSGKVNRMGLEDMITARLKQSVNELFDVETFDLIKRIKKADKPYKICVIGVNGSGKTTTLAKLVHMFQQNKLSVVVAASDTFRAAAIDQLKEHTDKLGVKLISQGYDADPAAVAYDAVEHAKAQKLDVVLIDTAGRLHSNTNLMAELEKVVRVSKPDLKLFVGEAITGNDCVEQAKVFNNLVGIDALVLSKADIDEKGGAAISVSFVTGKPILFLGTGQTYSDLTPFDKEKVIEAIGL